MTQNFMNYSQGSIWTKILYLDTKCKFFVPSGIQETLLLFVVVVQHNLEVTKHPVKDFPKQKPPILKNAFKPFNDRN